MAVNVSWIADCLPTIAASWDAIGVKTTLEPQDTAALFTKMDQLQDYQVVAAASNPNQFGIDADLIMRYNFVAGGLWMKYAHWDGSTDGQGAVQADGRGHPGAGPGSKKTDGPEISRRRSPSRPCSTRSCTPS